jgi:two-component system, OmpR family, response regulator
MRVLLVENDARLVQLITRALFERGHVVKSAETTAAIDEIVRSGRVDVAILDWELPEFDGIELLRGWRSLGLTLPVIVLTGKTETDAKIIGLRAGADDYLTKPFEFEELLARLEALFRRATGGGRIQVGGAVVDPLERTVTASDATERLTERETALLVELARHVGEPRSRAQLMESVWRGEPVHPNVVDVYVGYLRAKLDRLPAARVAITSVRKVGFRLDLTT